MSPENTFSGHRNDDGPRDKDAHDQREAFADMLRAEFGSDGHVTEDTLHTWLDDALPDTESARVAAHVSGCAVCQRNVAEARGLIAGSMRILEQLDAPAAAHVSVAPAVAVVGPGVHWQWWQQPALRAAALLLVAGGSAWMVTQRGGRVTPANDVVVVREATAPDTSRALASGDAATEASRTRAESGAAVTPPRNSPLVLPESALRARRTLAGIVPNAPVVTAEQITVAAGRAQDFSGRSVAGGTATRLAITASAAVAGGATGNSSGFVRGEPSNREPSNREQYDRIDDNPFRAVRADPLSTFSVDVDRASYGNVRRFITTGSTPPKDAVRIEELVNYFPYTLAEPRGEHPVAITSEVMPAPWQPQHRLVRVALQTRRIETAQLPPNNLVFLIDVSGSMWSADKLPLVQQALRLLVEQLREQDRVAIVVYAGAAGLVLPSTSGEEKWRITEAIDRLQAGGSTAGGAGLELAYRIAKEQSRANGNNRVILATDGDFNVGPSSDAEMERLIEAKRREGTSLTVLGFGTGNYQDAKMEKLAKRGDGNYAYIDNLMEARKVLVQEMGATLVTVANDVKLQVEFNPAVVQAYRLIGYENRLLRSEDFNDDRKDAGDMGAGHTVTALYEVVPNSVTGTVNLGTTDSLRYTAPARGSVNTATGGNSTFEMMFVRLRYKRPGFTESRLLSHVVENNTLRGGPSADFRFAASVAGFGMLLRESEYKGAASRAMVLELARGAIGNDVGGYRAEFVRLVERWRNIEPAERRD